MKKPSIGKVYSSADNYPSDIKKYNLLVLLKKQDLALGIPDEHKGILQSMIRDSYIQLNPNKHDFLGERYEIKEKGIEFIKSYEDSLYFNKLKKWWKEPDNQWKMFTFFGSPVLGFIVGVFESPKVLYFWHLFFH